MAIRFEREYGPGSPHVPGQMVVISRSAHSDFFPSGDDVTSIVGAAARLVAPD